MVASFVTVPLWGPGGGVVGDCHAGGDRGGPSGGVCCPPPPSFALRALCTHIACGILLQIHILGWAGASLDIVPD